MVSRRIQVRVLVSGAVQDIGFRALASRRALHWDLRGWIRHLDDGRIEAVFQGPESTVESMIAWCRKGPLKAAVQDVTVQRQSLEAFSGFDVRMAPRPGEPGEPAEGQ